MVLNCFKWGVCSEISPKTFHDKHFIFGPNLPACYFILFYFILNFPFDIIASQTSPVYTFEEKEKTKKRDLYVKTDAGDVESFSILPQAAECWASFPLFTLCVCSHVSIIYWHVPVYLFSCTAVLGFRGDDKVCILQSQAGRWLWCRRPAGAWWHLGFFGLLLLVVVLFFDTTAAGLMHTRILMSSGLFRDEVI